MIRTYYEYMTLYEFIRLPTHGPEENQTKNHRVNKLCQEDGWTIKTAVFHQGAWTYLLERQVMEI